MNNSTNTGDSKEQKFEGEVSLESFREPDIDNSAKNTVIVTPIDDGLSLNFSAAAAGRTWPRQLP